VAKYKFEIKQPARHEQILDYLRRTPSVRDVVVSGGDVANLPIRVLEQFVSALLDIDNIRDIRLASKGLMGLPQHFLQPEVLAGLSRLASKAGERGVDLALHTHVNHANQLTPLVAKAAGALHEMGFRDVRNQGVLLRGVNATPKDLLELCFTLLDRAKIMPYYFYTCDMIPNSEHWRTSIAEAQELQHAIMGYLPGFATPRVVADIPFVGKRWVHQVEAYDREKGISYWTKNYRTGIEFDDPDALSRRYEYYDPIRRTPSDSRQAPIPEVRPAYTRPLATAGDDAPATLTRQRKVPVAASRALIPALVAARTRPPARAGQAPVSWPGRGCFQTRAPVSARRANSREAPFSVPRL
jgi:lysine 2,3-aminomutase